MTKLITYIKLLWNIMSWVNVRQSHHIWVAAILNAFQRVFRMASFFLPLKLIILLSSEKIPKYMEFLPSSISYNSWIIILIICVPIFYLASILSSFFSKKFEEIILSEIKEDTQHYSIKEAHRLIKAKIPFLNGAIVLGIGLTGLFFLSWKFLIFVIFFIIIMAIIMEYMLFKNIQTPKLTIFKLSRNQFVEYSFGLSYLIVFGVLVIIMLTSEFDIFSAILSLLIMRLVIAALQSFFNEWAKNYKPLEHLNDKKLIQKK